MAHAGDAWVTTVALARTLQAGFLAVGPSGAVLTVSRPGRTDTGDAEELGHPVEVAAAGHTGVHGMAREGTTTQHSSLRRVTTLSLVFFAVRIRLKQATRPFPDIARHILNRADWRQDALFCLRSSACALLLALFCLRSNCLSLRK